MVKNVLITGRPQCGKSILIEKLIAGKRVGGISTPEVRKRGLRWGFKIQDLKTGRRGVLASVEEKSGPQVSKYRVNLENLDEIGTGAIENAIADPKVEPIVIDEIGKMECFSEKFRQAVEKALDSPKKVLAAISLFDFSPFIGRIKNRPDVKLFVLRRDNFEEVRGLIRTLF